MSSVKSKLARQAVKTTAKHTAHGAASKVARRPFRSITLLALGAALGGIVGWLIGRSGGDDPYDPIVSAPAPPSIATNADNSTEQGSETGAVS
jgi:ferric-dicitrate binding protein FerR (iron transport regulator)